MDSMVQTPRSSGSSGLRRTEVAKSVIHSIRFRLNLDSDGQYRFARVHFELPALQADFGDAVAGLMLGKTIRETLANLGQSPEFPSQVAEGLRSFLIELQPMVTRTI
ncbi:MAG: hypothetical protein ACREJ2_11200 [Planctomycetota bacterium]